MRVVLLVISLIIPSAFAQETNLLKVMNWNIWHGGREDGKEIGPQRVIEVIKESGAEIVAMQETYGSGELISKALDYHFHPRGTNVSIHSKFPVVEDISVGNSFNCAGAVLKTSNDQHIAFYSIWLPYSGDCWGFGVREKQTTEEIIACCDASNKTLTKLLADIKTRLSDPKYRDIPVIIAGDFNSMSHLDYTEDSKKQFNHVIEWATSKTITKDGFIDSYRTANSLVDRAKDATWSPRFPEQQQDRIDFIYHTADNLKTVASKNIRTHKTKFPSDHAALLTTLEVQSSKAER
jgi:endonuclease/exonuclease/phosphatase family metal-dependent hydrolase